MARRVITESELKRMVRRMLNEDADRYFKKGVGVFTCMICGRRTRMSEGSAELCSSCQTLMEYENGASDGNYELKPFDIKLIKRCIHDIQSRGGDPSRVWPYMTDETFDEAAIYSEYAQDGLAESWDSSAFKDTIYNITNPKTSAVTNALLFPKESGSSSSLESIVARIRKGHFPLKVRNFLAWDYFELSSEQKEQLMDIADECGYHLRDDSSGKSGLRAFFDDLKNVISGGREVPYDPYMKG